MFCNCLKIPTELSFDTQFRELNERSRLLLQVDMAREARIRLIASVRTSTRAAIRAVRRQERRARRWNLTGPYLEERTVYGLNFRAVTTYLNRKSDSRLLADIERILAGRPLLDCTSDSGPLAGQLSSIPFASEDVEICDRDTPDEQVLDTTNPHLRLLAQTVEMRPPGLTEGYILAVRAIRKSHRQWIIEAVRAIRRSYRQWIAVSVIALSFAILGYLGAAHWKHERDREREIQGQITGQHEDYAKRFFNDIYSGQDPCSDPVLVTLIPKPEECRKALESCYHVPHVDICGAPSVSEVFPNRKVCDDVASDTYPVCPPTSDK
jgi:hypothetical protein